MHPILRKEMIVPFQSTGSKGVLPGDKSLVLPCVVHPIATPGLECKTGEEIKDGTTFGAKGGYLQSRILTSTIANVDNTFTYEYSGVVKDRYCYQASPVAFRMTDYEARQTVDHNGLLVSSYIHYCGAGTNLILLGPRNSRLPIDNVKEVVAVRCNTGYNIAVSTYAKDLFIAKTESDGSIRSFERAQPATSRNSLLRLTFYWLSFQRAVVRLALSFPPFSRESARSACLTPGDGAKARI